MRNLLAHVFAIQNNAVEQREGNKRWRQKNGCGGVGGVRASGGGWGWRWGWGCDEGGVAG